MFHRKPVDNTLLDDVIEDALRELKGHDADTSEYAKITEQLTKLYALKETPDRISKEALLAVLGNLAGIVVIVGHERAHIITSKAISFVGKFK